MSDDLSTAIAELSSPDAECRAAAAQRLVQAGPEVRGAAVPLARAAGDDDEQVREWVVAALEELGPPAADDLPALISLLEDSRSDVVYWAATLLGRLGTAAVPAVARLTQVLDSGRVTVVRQRAAWALGEIGPQADGARAALERAAAGDDARLARMSRRALERLDD
jgi:HEAT repeat protein